MTRILTEAQQIHRDQRERIERLHRNPEQLARIVKSHLKDCAFYAATEKRGRRQRKLQARYALINRRKAERERGVVKPSFE